MAARKTRPFTSGPRPVAVPPAGAEPALAEADRKIAQLTAALEAEHKLAAGHVAEREDLIAARDAACAQVAHLRRELARAKGDAAYFGRRFERAQASLTALAQRLGEVEADLTLREDLDARDAGRREAADV